MCEIRNALMFAAVILLLASGAQMGWVEQDTAKIMILILPILFVLNIARGNKRCAIAQ